MATTITLDDPEDYDSPADERLIRQNEALQAVIRKRNEEIAHHLGWITDLRKRIEELEETASKEAIFWPSESDVLPERAADSVNHPAHYTSDPSGVECVTITRHRNFLIGSAIKYLWRAGLKQDADKSATEKQIEDLRKAIWYINEEIRGLEDA